MTVTTKILRDQTGAEELANSVSHGIALLAAVFAVPALIISTARTESTSAIIGVSVFGVSVILMYLASMVYHALPAGPGKLLLRKLDHAAIYLLIAGTYTPFTLGVLRGAWGWSLLSTIWALALLGIYFKARRGVGGTKWSTILYILMGWLVVVAIVPLWMSMSPHGLAWLISGGLAYTAGTVFYVAPKLPYAHFIWHLFVVAGTTCHFMAVAFHST